MVKSNAPESKHRVLLAVSGSIAAFKAAALASRLVQDGFEVRVVLTQGAQHFIKPLTFSAITGRDAVADLWEEERPGVIGHLELARWAEVLVVAPASASTVARLALGLADDLLGAVSLATRAPLMIAPAMETAMWEHPTTREHVAALKERGAEIVGPEAGHLASGAEGQGRMAEPEVIANAVRDLLQALEGLRGWKVLVTAGPTFERIDNVRYLGNRSSGKMGYALAAEARRRGAEVILVSGPVAIPAPQGVSVHRVESAAEMREAALDAAGEADAIVMAAAVADFEAASPVAGKLKRGEGLRLDLTPTGDISAELVRANPKAIHVGFALEAENLLASAAEKLRHKHLDLVVANAVDETHNPFGSDTNQVALVTSDGVEELPLMPKSEVASHVWDRVTVLAADKVVEPKSAD